MDATEEQTQTETQEQEQAENAAQDTAQEQETELKDKHGNPAISAHKYERDIKERDAKIKELEEQLKEREKTPTATAEEAKSETEGHAKRESLDHEARIKELEQQLEFSKIENRLISAGCLNAKAAAAVLSDYENDVEKLKEGAPYLFKQDKQKGSTGFSPKGETAEPVRSIKDAVAAVMK